MIGMNAIFHLASAIFVVVILWLYMQARSRAALMKRLWTEAYLLPATAPRRVTVDHPDHFLKEVCGALGIDYAMEGKCLMPLRIQPGKLMPEFAKLGVVGMRCLGHDESQSQGILTVTVIATTRPGGPEDRPEDSLEARLRRMRECFEGKVEFRFELDEGAA